MPYYVWRGVDLGGNIRKGKLFAKDVAHLDVLLLSREIALSRSQINREWIMGRGISCEVILHLFMQLKELVASGILLPEALAIVADQIEHRGLQEKMHVVTDAVHEGIALSEALKKYPIVFDSFMIQLIESGEESGSLALSLDGLCLYLQSIHTLRTQLRSALLIPAVTLVFFIVIFVIIFVMVVPQFGDAFISLGKELPASTRTMLSLSAFMRSWRIIIPFFGIFIVGLISYRIKKSSWGKKLWDTLLFKLPFVGNIMVIHAHAFIFQSLSLLLSGGVHLVMALAMIESATNNDVIKEQIKYISHEVRSGISLAEAMLRCPHSIFQLDAIALIRVAHESGSLATVFEQLSVRYHHRLLRILSRSLLFVQPVLMLILGLLVTLLIIALYLPIMSMSQGM